MFPITMSFTVSTPAELAKLVAATTPGTNALAGVSAPPAGKPQVKPAAPEGGPGYPQRGNDTAGGTIPSPKPDPAAASATEPSTTTEQTAAASGLDYDKDVKPAFLKLVQIKGRAAGRKIIDAFAPTKEKLSEAITTQEQYKQALDLIAKELA